MAWGFPIFRYISCRAEHLWMKCWAILRSLFRFRLEGVFVLTTLASRFHFLRTSYRQIKRDRLILGHFITPIRDHRPRRDLNTKTFWSGVRRGYRCATRSKTERWCFLCEALMHLPQNAAWFLKKPKSQASKFLCVLLWVQSLIVSVG